MSPRRYIERIEETYKKFFGEKPKRNVSSPLEDNDHPELDTSELMDDEGRARYQTLIGQMQWAVSIGRFGITTALTTMSSFRTMPRDGHMDRVKRMIGYLQKYKHYCIRFRTDMPDFLAYLMTQRIGILLYTRMQKKYYLKIHPSQKESQYA